jgi:YggT family protein
METVAFGFELAIALLRYVLLAAAVVVAAAAGLSWAVRTRRVSPFGGLARFTRARLDPMFAPMERRVVRAGGMPSHAPWWTLAAVVVTGIVLLSLLGFVRAQIVGAALAMRAGGRGVYVLLVTWTFGLLQLALFWRVISSWFQLSPYSPWVRWAFALTEWFLRPLRRVIPAFGMIDLTPLVAYFGLQLLQAILIRGI